MEPAVKSVLPYGSDWKPVFPALTTGQRYHLEVYGYVVVERFIPEDMVGRLLDGLQRFKREFEAQPDPYKARIRNCTIGGPANNFDGPRIHFQNVLEAGPAMLEYYAHPQIVGAAEEMTGMDVILEEAQAIINARDPNGERNRPPRPVWHRLRPGFMTFSENGLMHCNQVKALTNLTDLGPDDGGTVVIAGSHKMSCPEEDMLAAITEDPALVHQVIAPVGSTLFFFETLMHSSGQIRSARERTVIIGGYSPSTMRFGCNPSPEFLEGLSAPLRSLLVGRSGGWPTRRRRELGTPVGAGPLTDANPRGRRWDGWSMDFTDYK